MKDYSLLKYDEMFFRADRLIKAGEIVQAIEMLNEIIHEQPDYGKAHNHLGWVYETQYKDYPRAEKHYIAALNFEPTYPGVYLNYAVLLSTLGRFQELQILLEKALAIKGINKASVYNEYGIMHEVQGNFEEAIAAYRKSIQYSLREKEIKLYGTAIQRCELKLQILNSSSSLDLGTI